MKANNHITNTGDGDGLRVEKSSGKLYWRAYTGQVIEARSLRPERRYGKTDTSGDMRRDYMFPDRSGFRQETPATLTPPGSLNFDKRRIAWRDGTGVHYYFVDAIGSTRVATDASGNTCGVYPDRSVGEADYYLYGQENARCASRMALRDDYNTSCLPASLLEGSPTYKFAFSASRMDLRDTGKERDSESGFDNFGARYYSSGSSLTGRFLSPDWAARATAVPYAVFGDPQSLNLYGYVRDDPVTAVDADGHCGGNTQSCRKLRPNPLSSVSPAVKQAIDNSVKASDSKNADDKRGGQHEEGGIAWTKDGKQTVAPAEPGKVHDVTTPGHAEIDPYKTADLSKAKPGDVQADVVWHVHPAAAVVTSTAARGSLEGTTVIGGTETILKSFFIQTPSPEDVRGATPPPTLNIVVGAGNKMVYVYDSRGTTCQESLKEFNRQ